MIPIKLGLPVKHAVSNIKKFPRQPLNKIICDLERVKRDEGCESTNVVLWDKVGNVLYFSLLSSNPMERLKVPCGVFLVHKQIFNLHSELNDCVKYEIIGRNVNVHPCTREQAKWGPWKKIGP